MQTIPANALPRLIPSMLDNLLFYWMHTSKKFLLKVVKPIPTSPQHAAIHVY